MGGVLLGARVLLAATFVVAGIAKVGDREGSRLAVRDFGAPKGLSSLIGTLLPVCELAVAGALVASTTARWGALGALVLLTVFIAVIGRALGRGRQLDCHCFGQLSAAPVGRATLVRNVLLAGVAGFVLLAGWDNPGASAVGWLGELSGGALVGVGVGVVLLALQGWVSWQLLRQNGRLLVRIEQLEARGGEPPAAGLAPGTMAPGFSLATSDDRRVSLSGLLAAGSPALLVFSDAGCAACVGIASDVSSWRRKHGASLGLAVISREIDEQSPADALLDRERTVAAAYGLTGTPAGVLVDVYGRIASRPAMGRKAIARLVEHATRPSVDAARASVQLTTDDASLVEFALDHQLTASGLREPLSRPAI